MDMDTHLHRYRSLLDEDTRRARELISTMGLAVEDAIGRAIAALLAGDTDGAAAVIESDAETNAMQYQLRDLCFTIILTQAPVARDLREVLGFHHMAAELERMGDHCVGIARLTRDSSEPISPGHAADLTAMAGLCVDQVHDIIDALMAREVERARAIAARDNGIDEVYRRIFAGMMTARSTGAVDPRYATDLIFVAHHLERIGDRVTNLAEDLVYLETGAVEELG